VVFKMRDDEEGCVTVDRGVRLILLTDNTSVGSVKELHAQRLRTVGVFVFLLLAQEYAKGGREIYAEEDGYVW